MATAPESGTTSALALISAVILGPVGFLLCCLIVFGSTHGSQNSTRPTLALFGAVVAGPPIVLGVRAWRSGRRRWMGAFAITIGGLLAGLYGLAIALARAGHGS